MSGNYARLEATQQITNGKDYKTKMTKPLSKIWATDVFNLAKMEEALSKQAFKAMKKCMKTGDAIDMGTADAVAAAMKDWALSKGVKFFSHIFYPMTGATAEKHDGFIISDSDGNMVTDFTGSLLVKGEPDGSSFPNGGLRVTNAARGYTIWDPTSPAYIMNTDNGATLCIPSTFMSWKGHALDKKIPLLRSNKAMNEAATKVLTILGEEEVAPLNSSCGAEQEYFLVDANYAAARPDLTLTGRTLFGKPPAKGQEFDDHYFGAIPERVQVYMQDVEDQLYRLGIPAKTHHNEVAPAQFEIAPYYEAANVAADHQQLLMTVFKLTAKRHGFVCLFHEKPFAGINGSGKHVNWSVGNSTQGNLLDPGETPNENLNFLVFCGAVIRGVHKFGPLLRIAASSAGNDHRLGANEAPPAIFSAYLGQQIEGIFDSIKEGTLDDNSETGLIDLDLSQIPTFPKDSGDRNRTSPFAFTGNRFEFRAVGSEQSVAGPLITMNTMLADSLNWIAGKLETAIAGGADKQAAVISVLKDLMDEHGAAVFGGDGYSAEWHKEAEERGLINLPTSADAFPYLKDDAVKELFESTGVLSADELASRFEVYAEIYILKIEVEAKLVIDMAKTMIYPAATRYMTDLAATAGSMADLGVDFDSSTLNTVAGLTADMMAGVSKLSDLMATEDHGSEEDHMQFCAKELLPAMADIRAAADALEAEVADDMWPLPTYQEMLNIK